MGQHGLELPSLAECERMLAGLLAGMDTDRLIEVGDWMIECRIAGELLDRLNHKD